MANDEIGKRMKKYEYVSRAYLTTRTPVIIRVDGRAFHTFTRRFDRPFDEVLVDAMRDTMQYLCSNIQGCVVGYTQSDEISLALVDYKKLNSAAWFDYNIQKCASIAASMATLAFNKAFDAAVNNYASREDADERRLGVLNAARSKGAMFDARVFNIPKEEVCNYFYWRQLDAVRNSIQMVGQSQFSHSELHNKSCANIRQMLLDEKGIDWEKLPSYLRFGSCCVKRDFSFQIDRDIPMFLSENRGYIENLIIFSGISAEK